MTDQDVSIKLINAPDEKLVDSLQALNVQLEPVGHTFLNQEMVEKIVSHPGNHLFTAQTGSGQIVGCLILTSYPTLGGDKSWIEDVVVDQNFRGLGIGKKLVLEALSHAKKLGIKQVNLTSRPQRETANKLYLSLGFEIYNTNYYRISLDKLN